MRELARRVNPRIRSDRRLILGCQIWKERLEIRAEGKEVWMMMKRFGFKGKRQCGDQISFALLAAFGFWYVVLRSLFHMLVIMAIS